MSSLVSPSFPLGVFVGNPNVTDPTAEAAFDARYQNFVNLMGTQPVFMDAYVDQTVPISAWAGNASWSAASYANSPVAKNMIPVIGLPMTSTAAGSPSPDQFYREFAAGKYDSVIQAMVKSWSDDGFKTQYWRPGWEMNIGSMVSYEGNDAATQADWVKAFQHISNVLHAAGTADGVNVQVVWNPGIINASDSGVATKTVYPGNQYVDVIAADIYADISPYGGPNAIYDWSTQQTDTSLQAWASNSVNLQHYYTYPAATQWALDSSQGHSLSLQDLIDFAKAQGKPIAIGETGAGNTADGAGVSDNPTFVQWLYSTLANSGVNVDFVAIYDDNGGGNYRFSEPGDGKPLEAAAWAKYFGAHLSPITITSATSNVTTTDAAAVHVFSGVVITDPNATQSETVTVTPSSTLSGVLFDPNATSDGSKIVSGAWTINGSAQTVASAMDGLLFSPTAHQVAVGTTVATTLTAGVTDTAGQKASITSVVKATAVAATDTLTIRVSEDAWRGDAQYTIAVDGAAVGGTRTATTTYAAGLWQDVTVTGNWGAGAHTVGITFINDAYGGTAQTDRNLYVGSVTYDGLNATGAPASLHKNATATFSVPAASQQTAITLQLAEDAWQGDAQYKATIDGVQIGQNGTVTTLNASGGSQTVNLKAMLMVGTHDLAISFLNDAYGGTASTDRNLYIKGIAINGTALNTGSAALYGNDTDHFQFVVSSR